MSAHPLDILSSEGPIAAALGGDFEARPEQQAMARAVWDAMSAQPDADARHLLAEAGTGVGKSFAYLVPAMLRCAAGQRVVISTHTISLQEQLISKDIPLLLDAMARAGLIGAAPPASEPHGADDGEPEWGEIADDEEPAAGPAPRKAVGPPAMVVKAALVKGRGNYVSIRRLKMASARQHALFADAAALRSLHVIEDWAYSTLDGSLSTLPPVEKLSVWDRVQSDSANCMGRRCPTYKSCFYQKSRREMEEANLLVCNHAVFFSDLAIRSRMPGAGFLPEYHHVVLDEAHNVEDVASEHFGGSLTEGRVFHLLSNLFVARSNKGYLPQLKLLTSGDAPLDKAMQAVLDADRAARQLFDDLRDALFSGNLPSGRIPAGSPLALENGLSPAMRRIALLLKSLREDAADIADKFELAGYAQRAEAIADEATALLEQKIPTCVYWLEATGPRGGDEGGDAAALGRKRGFGTADAPRVKLACAPVEIGPLLKEHLFDKPLSVTLTSATLATKTIGAGAAASPGLAAFAHTAARLGVERPATLQLGSPFDYAKQVRLFIEADLPDPRQSRRTPQGTRPARRVVADPFEDDFGAAAITRKSAGPFDLEPLHARILHHIRETEGGAFVLFTSFSELNSAERALRPHLDQLGYPLLAQGRDGSRAHILARFREDERSVLLGAASFWQGVDVRGRSLRNVIIARLPFEPPDRPLTQARLERIEARGGNPFMEDSLPRAIIRFKQGFGRLIRSRSDSGRVVVLDPRIYTARYGRLFLEALPPGVKIEEPEETF